MNFVEPRENPRFFGHEDAEDVLYQACLSGRLHHSLLIAGPRGIGKATLAFRLARFLLKRAEADLLGPEPGRGLHCEPENPTFCQVAAGAHPSLRVVERTRNAETGRLARDINVDSIRSLSEFFRLTSHDGSWRIAIVDGAEDMNSNAANALLKILEEPPAKSLIVLISHAPGRLLPTIRSRCYCLQMDRLPELVLKSALRAGPVTIDDADIDLLIQLSDGSLGAALAIARADGIELHRQIDHLISMGSDAPLNRELDKFSEHLARTGQDERFAMFARMLEQAISRRVLQTTHHLGGVGLDRWLEVWEKVRALFAQEAGLGLDRKHVILNAFLQISEATRHQVRS